jgi:hypothetical protein
MTTTTPPEFTEFPKMPRLVRDMIVTEKIDGTNAQVLVTEDGDLFAGSRTRWITPHDDNYGFARWVAGHERELIEGLGPGRHFGEWWGSGIQRGYGLKGDDKRWSLFNTIRWHLHDLPPQRIVTADPRIEKYQEQLPACCDLVPVLHRGVFDTQDVEHCLFKLLLYCDNMMMKKNIAIVKEAALKDSAFAGSAILIA